MARDLVFCGTYTEPSRQAGYDVTPENPVMGMTGPTGSKGIYVFAHDRETGAFAPLGTASDMVNPSYVALDRTGRFLFAASEVRDFGDSASGAVGSFAIDRDTGALRFLGEVASGGGNPCHMSMSPDNRFLLLANHEAGTVAVFPVGADGRLSDFVDIHADQPVDHRQPHAHFITADPDGSFVVTTDTETDRVMIYRQDPGSGTLTPNDPPWGETHPGGSPRHLGFSPSGRYLFVDGEADLTLSLFRYDSTRGVLDYVRCLRTVPEGIETAGHSTAQMLVHPSGRFVYVANRGTDTIAIFRFDEGAEQLEFTGIESTRGETPRYFELDPTGRWLYAANQNSGSIERFAIDPTTGGLKHEARVATFPAPTCIRFSAA